MRDLLLAHRSTFGLVVAILAALLAAAPVIGDDGETKTEVVEINPGLAAGEPQEFAFDEGRFASRLPFDVQFFARAPVSDKVKALSGRLVELKRRPLDCREQLLIHSGIEVEVDYGDGSRRQARFQQLAPARKASTRRLRLGPPRFFTDTSTTPSVRKVDLSVPPLKPNRHHCFEFVVEKEADVAELLSGAFGVVDRVLRRVDRDFPDRLAAFRALRRELIEGIERALGPGERLVFDKDDSFFDLRVELEQIDQEALEALAAIATQQVQGPQVNDEYFASSGATIEGLEALRASAAYRQLVAELTLLVDSNARLSRVVGDDLAAFELDLLDGSAIEAVAEGRLAPDGTGVALAAFELTDRWLADSAPAGVQDDEAATRERRLAATLKQRIAQLEQTDSALQALSGALEVARRQELTQLSDPDLDELERTVEGLRVSIETSQVDLDNYLELLTRREILIRSSVSILSSALQEVVAIQGTTFDNYESRAQLYLSVDLGGAYAWDVEEAFTYAGANIYLRPVNKQAHLAWSDWRAGQRWDEFRKRFSFMVGVSVDKMIDDENRFMALALGRPAVLGAGVRLSDHLRFSVGALVFEIDDPDPLISRTDLEWTPFFSLSIDWNLAKILGGLAGGVGLD